MREAPAVRVRTGGRTPGAFMDADSTFLVSLGIAVVVVPDPQSPTLVDVEVTAADTGEVLEIISAMTIQAGQQEQFQAPP